MILWTKLFLALKLVILQISRGLKAAKCQTSLDGIALTGHTFLIFPKKNIDSCNKECKMFEACQSINFFKTSHMCHLNNRSITTKPNKKTMQGDSVYFERLRPTVIGSRKESPAESCMEIKTTTNTLVSGLYWVKHPLTCNINQIYCNMNTGEADGCFTPRCTNQGTCNNMKHGDYTCTCTAGFRGVRCELLGSECSSYSNISDATRSINHVRTRYNYCDSGLITKWYRFVGSAGVRLPTFCPSTDRCNTYGTGWLNGANPSLQEGIVTRTICLHWGISCCYQNFVIRVRNCESFLVYELQKTPGCSFRYCVTN